MPVLGTIAEIKPRGRSSRRREVWVDGEVVLEADEEVIVQGGLRPGRPLTEEEVVELRQADQALEASRLALRLLSQRSRSRHELVTALRRKRCPEEVVNLTLERLERAGLIDDQAFAQQMVDYYGRHRQLGRRAVHHKLRQAGVEASLAEPVLAETTSEAEELERARLVARKYLERTPRGDPRRLRARVYGLLQRRGFDAGLARQVTEEVVADDDSGIDNR
jgi:regulatory protein